MIFLEWTTVEGLGKCYRGGEKMANQTTCSHWSRVAIILLESQFELETYFVDFMDNLNFLLQGIDN